MIMVNRNGKSVSLNIDKLLNRSKLKFMNVKEQISAVFKLLDLL